MMKKIAILLLIFFMCTLSITTVSSDSLGIPITWNVKATVACTQGDICVNTTGWWRHNAAFNATSTQIQYAIDNATTGNAIYVFAGSYQEDIVINTSISLGGASRDNTTILRNTETNQVVFIGASNVSIDGFKIDGGASPYATVHLIGLSTAGSYNYTEITNCHILNCSATAIYLWIDAGQSIATGHKANNNIIEHFGNSTGYGGVECHRVLNVEVKNNTIREANSWVAYGSTYGATGIYFMDYTSGTITDNNITRVNGAIMVNSVVQETYIDNNTISEVVNGIMQTECFAKIHITNNTISTRPDPTDPWYQHGIILGGDGDSHDSCPPYSWQVDNLQHVVTGNNLTGVKTTAPDSRGIRVQPGMIDQDYGASGNVTNNTITGYDVGLRVYGTYGLTAHVHVTFENNNINSCTQDGEVDTWTGGVGNISAENNWWNSCSGPDSISNQYDYSPWLCEAYPTTWNSPCYPVSNPTNLQNTTGDGWVNYTWDAGTGNVTNSYNVSWNSTWYNNTLVPYMNDTVGELNWANISVWAFNNSCGGNLSVGDVSDNVQTSGGAFTTSMTTTVYNLITYYGSTTSTAEQFGNDIGSVDFIAMYNGSFVSHTMTYVSNNFTVYHGIGYYVYLNASGSSTYQRNNISDVPYNTQLFNRWNTIGWTNSTDTNAEGVATSIGSTCKYTSMLNADGVTYTTHTVGFTSNNHAINKGQGYWVWVNTGLSWSRNS